MPNNSMNFGVDLLPSTTNQYTLGSSDKKWIINGVTNPQLTDNDTKNTVGSTNSTSKLFLIGAASQAANPTTNSYQYTYVTEGVLSSNQFNLNVAGTEKVQIKWNANDNSIDFVFN